MPATPDWPSSLGGVPLREALEHTGIGVVVADSAGRLLLVSPALEALFQVGREVWQEDDAFVRHEIQHADGRPMAAEEMPMARAVAGEFVKAETIGARTGSGELLWLECNGAPIFGADGGIDGCFILTHDVTARHRAAELEEELRQRLVHTVNHEFRTPLAALLGNLEVVRDHLQDGVSDDLARSLAAIERAAWRLDQLVCTAASLIEKQGELHAAGRQPDGAPRRTA